MRSAKIKRRIELREYKRLAGATEPPSWNQSNICILV